MTIVDSLKHTHTHTVTQTHNHTFEWWIFPVPYYADKQLYTKTSMKNGMVRHQHTNDVDSKWPQWVYACGYRDGSRVNMRAIGWGLQRGFCVDSRRRETTSGQALSTQCPFTLEPTNFRFSSLLSAATRQCVASHIQIVRGSIFYCNVK